MSNVKAGKTRPNDEQPWRCQVCGQELIYSQPIDFRLAMHLVKLFSDFHDERCKAPEVAKEGD